MAYTLEQIGCKEHRAICRCGGYGGDHDVSFQYWPDAEFGDSFTISTSLNHFLPWYKRIWVGLKYALGIDNTYYFYKEADLDAEQLKSLSEWISSVAVDYKETPDQNPPLVV